jgi:hypothetical protein
VTRLCGLIALLQVLPASAGEVAFLGRSLLEQLAREQRNLEVGQWVTYELDGGEGRASYWRIAVVSQERDKNGRDALWIEIEIGTHPQLLAPLAQLRVLMSREAGMTAEGISRLVIGQGFDKPLEVSPEQLAAFVAERLPPVAPSARRASATVQAGRRASLLTAAGAIQATPVEVRHRSLVVQRLWVSPQVPVLHLARVELPAVGQSMTVHAFGSDASPRVELPSADEPRIHLEEAP